MPLNVLILGGTAEANRIAEHLALDTRFAATLSLAGRTLSPRLPPVTTRVGGFGGAEGLTAYLAQRGIDVLLDATHPFAARISANAAAAAGMARVPLVALSRPAWEPEPGDLWTRVPDLPSAAATLPNSPTRVFLAVGRQSLMPFAASPQHHYVIRVIDPPEIPSALTAVDIVTGRGPFRLEDEIALLRTHRINWLVTKNSGGDAAYAKLAAARALKVPAILIDRPAASGDTATFASVEAVLQELGRLHDGLAKRSV